MLVKKTFALISVAATISIGFGWLLYKNLQSKSVNVVAENTALPNDAEKVANPVEESLADKIDKKVQGSKTTIECLYHIFSWSNDDIKKFVRIDKKNPPAVNDVAMEEQHVTPTATDNAGKDLEEQENNTGGIAEPKVNNEGPLGNGDKTENEDEVSSEQPSPIEATQKAPQTPAVVEPLQETIEQQPNSVEDVSSAQSLDSKLDGLKKEVSTVSKNVEDIKTGVGEIQADLKDQKVTNVELEKHVTEDKDADQHLIEGKDEEHKADNVDQLSNGGKDDELKDNGDDQHLIEGKDEEHKVDNVDQLSNGGKDDEPKDNGVDQLSNGGKDEEHKVDNVDQLSNGGKDDELKDNGDDQHLIEGKDEEHKVDNVDQLSNGGKDDEPKDNGDDQLSNGEEQEEENGNDEYNEAIQSFDKFKNEMKAEMEGNDEEYKLLHAFISSDPIITNPEDRSITLDDDMVRYLDDIKHDLADILSRDLAPTPNMLEEKCTIDGKSYSLYELVLVKVAQATKLYSY